MAFYDSCGCTEGTVLSPGVSSAATPLPFGHSLADDTRLALHRVGVDLSLYQGGEILERLEVSLS